MNCLRNRVAIVGAPRARLRERVARVRWARVRCASVWRQGLFDELDVVGFDLDGGGEIALFEVDDKALGLAASLAHQTAFETIETTTDDADVLAVETRGDFVETVILYHIQLVDGLDETQHDGVAHSKGLELLASTHITILQQGQLSDYGVELGAGLMNKDKVGHIGNETHHTLAKLGEHALLHRNKQITPPQRVAAAVVYRRDSWRWDVLNRATHTNNLPLKKETEKVGLGQILLVLLASIFI